MRQLPRGVVIMLAISALATIFIIASDFIIPASPQDQLRLLRRELTESRADADSCLAELEREESQLLASDARLDSLKSRIEHYEGLDPRGVPADSYGAYLETFNSYNAGVPGRTAAADTLQAHWQSCTEIVEQHNALADSARELARELGVLRDLRRRVPVRQRDSLQSEDRPASATPPRDNRSSSGPDSSRGR